MTPATSPAPKKLTFKDIEKMRRGRRAYEIFLVPFMEDAYIAFRLLSQAEYMACEDRGKIMAKESLTEPTQTQIDFYIGYHVLYEACYVPPDSGKDILQAEKFFESPEKVAELSTDELTVMINYYTEMRDKYGVFDQFTNPEDFVVLIDEIKKNSPLGMSLSTVTLKKLLLFSLSQDWNMLQKANGLTSTPLNSPDLNGNEKPLKPTSIPNQIPIKESRLMDKK